MGNIALRLMPLLAGIWASVFPVSAQAAAADACKPLRLINSIKMTTNSDRSRFYVPVAINGTPKNLILDTGGGLTHILQSVAKELKLGDTYSRLATRDLSGNESDRAVRVATFDLGNQRGENLKFQLAPMTALPDDAAGLLSTDLFLQYDIDLDFGAERLNYFSQDHCEGKVAYWPERPLAILPVDLSGGHLNVDVTLDGEVYQAVLDTGAPITTTSVADIAGPFHLRRGSPDLPVIAEAKDNPGLKVYAHNFQRLSFGDITVLHPQIGLLPEVGTGAVPFGSAPRLRMIIIGMNVLKQLHIYIAYGEKKLYITPAGAGESALFKATTPP
jgi:predicted aspartyl protease